MPKNLSTHLTNSNINYLIVFFLILLTGSCAQQVIPEGGPQDDVSPGIASSLPENFSTNFSEKKIKITFNEFVQLKNIQSQLIISPPLNEFPDIRLNGKVMTITLLETLKPNTTYSFNFGNSIGDLTENNTLDSNLFVFSTGNFLDTSQINGYVKNAFTLAPEKEVLVMLYEEMDDSVFHKRMPYYFTKTKEDGSYKLNYLKKGSYKLVALLDGNTNYLFDLPNEKIAFELHEVASGDSTKADLYLFQEDNEKQYVKKSFSEYGKITLVFNRPLKDYSINVLNYSNKKPWFIEDLNVRRDTLIYWLHGMDGVDSLSLLITENTHTIDTLHLALVKKPDGEEKNTKRREKVAPLVFSYTLNVSAARTFNLFDSLTITFNNPISEFKKDSIILLEADERVTSKLIFDDPVMRKMTLCYPWKEDTEYQLYIPVSTCNDLFGLTNDTISVKFKTGYWDDYAAINIVSNFKEKSNYIIQLQTDKEIILRENKISSSDKLAFKNVSPGKYRLKLIVDKNTNGKWDTGNYTKHIQPEKVFYYPDIIELRKGFDMEINWKID